MKNIRIFGIILFLLFFFIDLSFSTQQHTCCYNFETGEFIPSDSGVSCTNSYQKDKYLKIDIDLGSHYFKCSTDSSLFDNFRKSYEDVNGDCMNTFRGHPIISDNNYLNALKSISSGQSDEFDISKVSTYDSSCNSVVSSSGSSNQGSLIVPISHTGITSSGETEGDSMTPIFDDNLPNNVAHEQEVKRDAQCAGNFKNLPLGLFYEKNSCISTSSEYKCVYNPELGGLISQNDFVDVDHYKYSKFESKSVCVSNNAIKSCFDFKTKAGCDNSLQLDNRICSWINSSEYGVNNNFVDKQGMCIDNLYGVKTFYNYDSYFDRGNLIIDPSFELFNLGSNNPWQNLSGVSISNDKSYNNKKSIKFTYDGELSQEVELKPSSSYTFSFYYYLSSSDVNYFFNHTNNNEFNIIFEYKNFSKDIVKIEEYNLTNYPYLGNFFQYFTVPIASLPNYRYINISFKSTSSKNIFIDGVNLGASSKLTIDNDKLHFFPVNVIPSEASNCNLCFEQYNLNYCTEKKSNLLGDCSYMVTNITKSYDFKSLSGLNLIDYYGNESNRFIQNWSSKWSSQSVSNADLFCEMYLHNSGGMGSCENPNNFVNSQFTKFHSKSGNTLCKWDNTRGCFKDSNDDNYPDTRINLTYPNSVKSWPAFNYFKKINSQIYSIFTNSNYEYVTDYDTNIGISDFDLGCDVLPPSSYVYFKGKNASNEPVIFENSFSNGIGALNLYIDVSDAELDSCINQFVQRKVSFPSHLYMDYNITNSKGTFYGIQEYSMNQWYVNDDIKNIFKNSSSDETYLIDGNNKISFSFWDQSGNVGKTYNFNLDLDVNAPVINLSNLDSSSFYGKNSFFNVVLNDSTSLKSCTFNFEYSDTDIPSDLKYNSSIQRINFTNPTRNNISKINISNYIFSTEEQGSTFKFKITCSDIYGQKSSASKQIHIDLNSSLLLINPFIFSGYDQLNGFYNTNSQNLFMISKDDDITSCSFTNTQDFAGSFNFNKANIKNDYEFQQTSFNPFYNITGILNFTNGNGRKQGNLTCEDGQGNDVLVKLDYYYDSIAPSLSSFDVIGPDGNLKTVIKVGNKYYTTSSNFNDLKFNISLNATGTWIWDDNNKLNITLINEMPLGNNYLFTGISNNKINFDLTNVTYKNDLLYLNTNFNDGSIYSSNSSSDLYHYKYRLDFFDKANNSGYGIISLYKDISHPSISFGGQINEVNHVLYTNIIDPKIEISFGTPTYRKFDCNVTIATNFHQSKSYTSKSKKFSFKLSDFTNYAKFDMNPTQPRNLNIYCTDSYNYSISSNIQIKYDNVSPVIDDVTLSNGLNRNVLTMGTGFSLKGENILYTFKSPGESAYYCNYTFVSNDPNIICGRHFSQTLQGGLSSSISNVIIFSSLNPQLTDMCSISAIPTSKYAKLRLYTTCYDNARNSDSKSKNISINFLNVTQVVKKFKINYVPNGNGINYMFNAILSVNSVNSLKVLDSNNVQITPLPDHSSISNVDGSFNFTKTISSNLILPGDYPDGSYNLNTNGDLSGINLNKKITSLKIDRVAPKVNISSSDFYMDNIITNSFDLNLHVQDTLNGSIADGKLRSVEVKEDGTRIYFSNGNKTPFYDNKSIMTPISDCFDIVAGDSSVSNSKITYFNATYGQTYTFEITACDYYGNNCNSTTLSAKYEFPTNVLNFSGVGVDEQNNILYSNTVDANFNVSAFNPKLNLTCNITAAVGVGGGELSSIGTLKNFINVNLSNFQNIKTYFLTNSIDLTFRCIIGSNKINKIFIKDYTLKFDNTPPELNYMFLGISKLSPKNSKVYPIIANTNYYTNHLFKEKVSFDLNNTHESLYTCYYRFNSSDYDCANSNNWTQFDASMNNGVVSSSNLINIYGDSSSICRNKQGFFSSLSSYNIKVEGYCRDAAGLVSNYNSSNPYILNLKINYSNTPLTSFTYGYNGKFVAKVTSILKLDSLNLSENSFGNTFIGSFALIGKTNGEFVYEIKFNASVLGVTGEKTLYAIGSLGGHPYNLSNYFINDIQSPMINDFSIATIGDDGSIFENDFILNFDVEDNLELDSVDIYVGNILVWNATYSNSNYIDSDNTQILSNRISGYIKFKNVKNNFGESGKNLNIVANDSFSLTNQSNLFVKYNDNLAIILEDSSNTKVDNYSGGDWITKEVAPIIKFRTTKESISCDIAYYDNNTPKLMTVTASDKKNYEFNFSSISGFDLNHFNKNLDFELSCHNLINHLEKHLNLKLVDYLPDYVLTSDSGFALNEPGFIANLKVKSVGIYKGIKCSYNLNNQIYNINNGSFDDEFLFDVNFSSLNSGNYNLDLSCEDVLGNIGPTKTYTFVVDKSNSLNLNNLKIIDSNGVIYDENNSNIYLNTKSNLGLSFDMNVKYVSCYYKIEIGTGVFSTLFNFVKDIFGISNNEIRNIENLPYTHKSLNNFSFSSDIAKLKIDCDKAGFNSFSKIINLTYLGDTVVPSVVLE